jgi:NTP pyrophosphatase (non-canonical NTP hydrolase)
MQIDELVAMQIKLDEANGFPVTFVDMDQRYDQLTKDLVGLVGEVGEFANTLKKVNIKRDRPNEYELDLNAAAESLKEELADCAIYLFRISAILEVNLEKAVVRKIQANADRYAKLRRP